MTYQHKLKEIVLSDPKYLVMTAENRGPLRNIIDDLGSRFLDVGIMEQGMIGTAAGLALRGRVPIVHSLSCFLTMRAFEFVRTDVGLGKLPVKMTGTLAGFLSEANGPTHQSIEDIGLMRMIPNVNIFCPADELELCEALPIILESPQPWYIRFNPRRPVERATVAFAVGQAEVVRKPGEVTILTYGALFEQAYAAALRLERNGISTGLINMRTLKPVDECAVVAAAKESGLLVIVEDHLSTGGLYSIVCETLVAQNCCCPVVSLSLNQRWFKPLLYHDVLDFEGFSGEKLAERIAAAWEGLASQEPG
ncbi:MAG: transketolase [Chitinivibrionales bacterium]|nr:transketolase [Chitinivibrionales bacterium]